MTLKHWLQFFRFPNLFIVVLTQILLWKLVILRRFPEAGIEPVFDLPHFLLFTFVTVLIAASGYVINDIVDMEIDLVNKPEKTWIGTRLSKKVAQKIYWWIIGLGFIIACFLAIYVDNLPLLLIYPVAVILLWWYAVSLKKKPFLGNLVIAIFCAFVAGIVLVSEWPAVKNLMENQPDAGNYIWFLFCCYLVFALISTLLREVIKDIEDIDGDLKNGCRTLPIAFGKRTAKFWAAAFALILMILVAWFSLWLYGERLIMAFAFSWLAIILPTLILLFRLRSAEQKSDFSTLSTWTKGIMLSGLILLFLI